MNLKRAVARIISQEAVEIRSLPIEDDSGVTNRVASPQAGIFSCFIRLANGSVREMIVKCKSAAIIANGIRLLSKGDPMLFWQLVSEHKVLGYNGSSVRESVLYSGIDRALAKYMPHFIGSYTQPFTRSCFIAMEKLPQSPPHTSQLYRLIDIITYFHVRYYNDLAAAARLKLNRYTVRDHKAIRRSLKRMFHRLDAENAVIFGADKLAIVEDFLRTIHIEYRGVSFHCTLTHNDFSPRNISAYGDDIRIYDWELAAYQNPEHDIIELLISMLHDLSDSEVLDALRYQRERLSLSTGIVLTDRQYRDILRFNTLEYCVNKLTILRLAGKHLGLNYTEKLAENAARMMDILNITQKREEYATGT